MLKKICSVRPLSPNHKFSYLKVLPCTTFKGNYYQYSVVSDPLMYDPFVLARNVTEFKQNYEETVLTKLKEQGFLPSSTTNQL